ncbi:MCE family protein [Mycobacterium sp. CBMA271]|uniref:MCE family protein n=1 Tax=unclassified Mycobacteroides TaxID=2618759 RepID=UPI0012DEC3DA|nr:MULTISPECIES: MCE family protein [unclassified Mycobacteroides]MUM19386.1 mammalian cell entry protein [Mycobacteroides sp. CBMA 326]MUM21204.1 MCE family protein [Mycobacteroides sp. CBMA 271]
MSKNALRGMAIGVGVAVVASGCQFNGLNSLNLPGTTGHGAGSYTITVELPDVTTMPQNSPVMVDDVTVGSIAGIDAFQKPDGSWYAGVKVTLGPEVQLPANAVAKVAQTSLLGSQHIELSAPTEEPAVGRLVPGATIPLNRTGKYPSTEEVLSALSLVVNKGNLGAIQDITDETYNLFKGRTGNLTQVLPKVATLISSLNAQRADIISAVEGIDKFARVLAEHKESLGRAIDSIEPALKVLNENRANVVEAFRSVGNLAKITDRVLRASKEDLVAILKNLYPVIRAVSENRDDFINSLDFLPTFPFSTKYMRQAVRGDYLNVFVTFDLTARRLGETLFTTSFFDPNMQHFNEVVNPPEWLIGSMANLNGKETNPFDLPAPAPAQGGGR